MLIPPKIAAQAPTPITSIITEAITNFNPGFVGVLFMDAAITLIIPINKITPTATQYSIDNTTIPSILPDFN
jgi:hypothetical protein